MHVVIDTCLGDRIAIASYCLLLATCCQPSTTACSPPPPPLCPRSLAPAARQRLVQAQRKDAAHDVQSLSNGHVDLRPLALAEWLRQCRGQGHIRGTSWQGYALRSWRIRQAQGCSTCCCMVSIPYDVQQRQHCTWAMSCTQLPSAARTPLSLPAAHTPPLGCCLWACRCLRCTPSSQQPVARAVGWCQLQGSAAPCVLTSTASTACLHLPAGSSAVSCPPSPPRGLPILSRGKSCEPWRCCMMLLSPLCPP